ncbi:hypothetical protein [Streptomyces sp. NPDC006285]|uniref:hypothetical protein n=1 Tax=Streptomyces sp. NPDC006285 TaxID=3364742 RepID=UPI0036B761C4
MNESRTPAQVLREARQKESRDKRAQVLSVVEQPVTDDEPVTFTGVARATNVSHWLVYAEGVREHIEAARRRQGRAATNGGVSNRRLWLTSGGNRASRTFGP